MKTSRPPRGTSAGNGHFQAAAQEASNAAASWELIIALAIIWGFLCVVAAYAYDIAAFLNLLAGHPVLKALGWISFACAALSLILLAIRTAGWFLYSPAPRADPSSAPSLTVVIPAYNEGAMVRLSIDAAARAEYPRDRFRIVVVDDGSRDDTWTHIQAASAEHAGLVLPVRLAENQGKRAALAEGFRATNAEVLVVIDSDSVIEPGALLSLAGPFRNPLVGAVSGRVSVYNEAQGIIPRLLHVNFLFIADFFRSWESIFGTVHCCPGALMAVRASVAKASLDEWLGQTFLGVRCAIGDDRSMTNCVLLRRFDTVYQRTAVVRTVVPATYAKLCRMLIRWNRSYIREDIRFLHKVVWRRPWRALVMLLFDRVITDIYIPVCYLSLPLILICIESKAHLSVHFLGYIGWMSIFYVLFYLRHQRSSSAVYAFFYPFAACSLFWIFPYAALTLKNRSWMTR